MFLDSGAFLTLALSAPPFIFSLVFHEWAHAWLADKLGDSTARYMGRLTLDPTVHVSLIGTIILPAIAILTGLPGFGWAKPVPIDMRNFRKPRLHMGFVAASGPLSNFLLAILAVAATTFMLKQGFVSQVRPDAPLGFQNALMAMLEYMVRINLFLAFFNLIPLPPLDGGRIVQGFASESFALKMDAFEQTSQLILLGLLFLGVLRFIIIPVDFTANLLFRLFL